MGGGEEEGGGRRGGRLKGALTGTLDGKYVFHVLTLEAKTRVNTRNYVEIGQIMLF